MFIKIYLKYLLHYIYQKIKHQIKEEITFYVYRQEQGDIEGLTLKEAMREFKKPCTDSSRWYKSLGVQDKYGAIDLLIEDKEDIVKLSQDYLQVPRFKDNKLISINTINILRDNFISE